MKIMKYEWLKISENNKNAGFDIYSKGVGSPNKTVDPLFKEHLDTFRKGQFFYVIYAGVGIPKMSWHSFQLVVCALQNDYR